MNNLFIINLDKYNSTIISYADDTVIILYGTTWNKNY